MKKVGVIGVYGRGEDFTTGQTVKCFELINWLKKPLGKDQIFIVNTYGWKKNPFGLLKNCVKAFLSCERVIILPAPNGVKVFLPLCYALKKIFRKDVHYVVIGGWLAELLSRKPFLKRCAKSFEGVYAESTVFVNDLKKLGLENAVYMPNFRSLPEEKHVRNKELKKPFKVCTYSRVVKEKGIEDACEIVKRANELFGERAFELDVWGKIDSEFREEFSQLRDKYKDIMSYRGVKKADEGVKTLSEYFALLFPTYYEGEGLAGTVLDAFAAGTPVIANNWRYNGEFVKNGVNGEVYPFRDVERAAEALVHFAEDEKTYAKMTEGCFRSAVEFSADSVLGDFYDRCFSDCTDL